MASVRMTGILREEIMRNAMNAFDKANPEIQYKPKYVNEIIDKFTSSPVQQFWKQTHTKATELYSDNENTWNENDNVIVGEITEFKCLLESPYEGSNDKWISFNENECPKFLGYHPSKNLGRGDYYNCLKHFQ